MATWVTHLMIADGVLTRIPEIDRRGFCVGNIAPDCNVENADWTSFTPSREVTHWMSGERKTEADCDSFCHEYITSRKHEIKSQEEYSFLLGYYAHLLTDSAFQSFIRDEKRIRDAWIRIKSCGNFNDRISDLNEDWESVKKLIPKSERLREIYTMEGEYLKNNPNSGYLTEILPLKSFPDYIDYMPEGCIVRKIGVMGYLPKEDEATLLPISISREELFSFVENTIELVIEKFEELSDNLILL